MERNVGIPANRASDRLAIRCAGLTRRFGTLAAVNKLDLEVRHGEVFALVGPDGAGKTTLIRLLCGVLTPDAGEAVVAGFDVVADPERVKTRIGYMPQRFSLYGDLTVMENLQLYAGLHEVPPKEFPHKAEQLLADFRLSPFQSRLAQHLSGGMKQKLALVCTLIHEPEVLLLDEPTTGVDPVSRQQFWRILYDLNRRGITIFVSTPYMDEAERAAHVGLMNQGRIIATGSPASLRALMEGEILEVVAEPQAAAKNVLRGHPSVRSLEVFGDRLHVLVPVAEAQGGLESALAAAGVTLKSIRQIPPSLEDVFVARLGVAAA
jgi:ABC-2 type transport system ATP-binding protein